MGMTIAEKIIAAAAGCGQRKTGRYPYSNIGQNDE